jgi:uncharacterized protein YndB with AHSA1/START domain
MNLTTRRAAAPGSVSPVPLALWLALAALALPSAARAAERAIDKEVVVAAPVDQVWATWTTREGIRSFFAPEAVVEPRVGGLFEMQFDPGAAPGDRGADGMRFMALQPPRMLSFEWNAPPSLPAARAQRTFVVVRLVPVDDKTTRVTLHHTGWGDGGEWDRAYSYFDRAWGGVLGNLKKRFDSGPVDWTPWLQQLEKMRAATTAPK